MNKEIKKVIEKHNFFYDELDKIMIKNCPICKSTNIKKEIAKKDRYGFNSNYDMCMGCSTIFINPRMTKKGYSEFNIAGIHGELLQAKNAHKHKALSLEVSQKMLNSFNRQLDYAKEVVDFLECSVKSKDKCLDIGAFTGGLSVALKRRYGACPFIVEPDKKAYDYAIKQGVVGSNLLFEDFETSKKFDIIFLCRSVDHLVDPLSSMRKINNILNDDGLFYFDFLNFNLLLKKSKQMRNSFKLEHPYAFSDISAMALTDLSGFTIIKTQELEYVTRCLCKKSKEKIPKYGKESKKLYNKVKNRRGI